MYQDGARLTKASGSCVEDLCIGFVIEEALLVSWNFMEKTEVSSGAEGADWEYVVNLKLTEKEVCICDFAWKWVKECDNDVVAGLQILKVGIIYKVWRWFLETEGDGEGCRDKFVVMVPLFLLMYYVFIAERGGQLEGEFW